MGISKATSSRGFAVHEGWMVMCHHVVAISYFDKPDIRALPAAKHVDANLLGEKLEAQICPPQHQ